MYMDILEQEVEALGEEVMRLRLMVHRVTQVMEAPIPDQYHHQTHTDPLHTGSPPTAPNAGTSTNLQATLDSFKQVLPLVQLLLADQQRNDAALHVSKKGHSSRHHRHQSRHRCSSSSGSKSTYNSQQSPRPTSTCSSSHRTDSSTGASSLPHPREKSKKGASGKNVMRALASAPAATAPSAPSSAARGSGQAAPASPRLSNAARSQEASTDAQSLPEIGVARSPASTSVVDRLQAQRRDEAANIKESFSSSSSSVMPMAKMGTRARVASHSAAEEDLRHDASPSRVDMGLEPNSKTESAVASAQLLDSTIINPTERKSSNIGCFSPAGDAAALQHSPTQLPGRTNALALSSTSSSSSGKDAEKNVAKPQDASKATSVTPLRSGVILGVRQPISMQSLTKLSPSAATPTSVQGPGSGPIVAASPGKGGHVDARTPSQAVDFYASSSPSSSSDNAEFRHPLPRVTAEAGHLDSSFHNYSDVALSNLPSQGAESPNWQPVVDPSVLRSHDGGSLSGYSFPFSFYRSPQQQDGEASSLPSQLLSNSPRPHHLARSVSVTGPPAGLRGPFSAGGYYYGYDNGSRTTSQPSMESFPAVDT